MFKDKIHEWVNTALIIVMILFVSGLVGGNQSSFGGSTRFPNSDLSAATITSTGTLTASSAMNVTGAATLSDTLSVAGDTNYNESTETHTASTTLTIAESGKVNFVATANTEIILPAATTAEGVTYRFVVSGNFATTDVTITGGAADATDDLIYGVLTVNGALIACSAEDTVSFVASAELQGDYVDFHSDGVLWYVSGQGTTAGSITCTDAD